MGNDLSVVKSARASYNAVEKSGQDLEKDMKLIHYLMKHNHTSPFESVVATFEVKAPIFVFRQWMRHRTQSFNEVSARYTELKDDYYIPETQQITTQSSQNKQMKTDRVNCDAEEIKDLILKYSESSFIAYKRLLELGCPREMARAVLPMGTYSTMIVTANLLNWFKFIRLRSCEKSQYEIRVYSDSVLEFLRAVAPIACEAFEKYNND